MGIKAKVGDTEFIIVGTNREIVAISIDDPRVEIRQSSLDGVHDPKAFSSLIAEIRSLYDRQIRPLTTPSVIPVLLDTTAPAAIAG